MRIKYKILNKKWTISFVDKDDSALVSPLGEKKYYGTCSGDSLEIFIGTGYDLQIEKRCLIHELTHAYLDLMMNNKESYDQEFVCDFVALRALDIVKDAEEIWAKKIKLERKTKK